jgi:hypothetical protein
MAHGVKPRLGMKPGPTGWINVDVALLGARSVAELGARWLVRAG